MTPAQTYQKQDIPPVLVSDNKVLEYLRNPQLAPGAILAHDPRKDIGVMLQAVEYSGRHPQARHVFAEGFGNTQWFCRLTPNVMYQRIIIPDKELIVYFRFDETTATVPYQDLAYFSSGLPPEHSASTIEIQTAFSHTLTNKRFFDMYQADKVMSVPVIYCKTSANDLEALLLPPEQVN